MSIDQSIIIILPSLVHYPQVEMMYYGLVEHVYSLGTAHTHMLDNTTTFCAIPSSRYEPRGALLESQRVSKG